MPQQRATRPPAVPEESLPEHYSYLDKTFYERHPQLLKALYQKKYTKIPKKGMVSWSRSGVDLEFSLGGVSERISENGVVHM